jgi:esterase/lipase
VWSLADDHLFRGAFGRFLEQVGAVSTRNPERDRLIVKTLLTGEADWIIFPEGRMVKNKKIYERGRFIVSFAGGKHPPHTGAATLAMRTAFYRQRLRVLSETRPEEARRLSGLFDLGSAAPLSGRSTFIVPVNLTYYPIRARENLLSQIAHTVVHDLPERALDEIMTEGTMMLSGVDMDIRFGEPIDVHGHLGHRVIQKDVTSGRDIGFNDILPSRPRMRKEALKLMNRYMHAIYRMTTVNHDHLLASLLRHQPRDRFDEATLLRRAFLAVPRDPEATGSHFHSSLRQHQLHLLVDDRFGKVQDFFQLALKTAAVKRDRCGLLRDRSQFSGLFDFNRARTENPVGVIANEVEPLKALQRRIRLLAWTPDFLLRRRIARDLHRSAVDAFLRDYETYFREGESHPKHVGRPVFLRGRRGAAGVLLVHGYMAAPREMHGLAAYLAGRGLWVYVPRLSGHGTSPDDLAVRTWRDWRRSVDQGFAVLRCCCRKVVVGGFSTGAGLALELAVRVQGLTGVFAVAPPLQLQDFSARFVPAVEAWNRFMDRIRWREAKKEFVENHPENPGINYRRNPVSGLLELERLMDEVSRGLHAIEVPALVVQADQDPVVNPSGARKVYDRLGSEDKAFVLFHFERHGILLGPGAERVYRSIDRFLQGLAERP